MIDSTTDLQAVQASLDSEQALLRQKQAIATERVVRLEVRHQALVTRCREAKEETADLALELEQAKFVFMADRGKLDAAILEGRGAVALALGRGPQPDHVLRDSTGAWVCAGGVHSGSRVCRLVDP